MTGSIGPVGATPAPNNDNAPAESPNTIPYLVFFNAGSTGRYDVEFATSNSGGTTEYLLPQNLVNNTGQTWFGYEYILGFGTGDAFVSAGGAGGLDFDTPDMDPAPASNRFASLVHQPGLIQWSAGAVPSVGSVQMALSIDVPDGIAVLNPSGLPRFTLRQRPLLTAPVPEPGALAMLWGSGAGAAALALRRLAGRRKRGR